MWVFQLLLAGIVASYLYLIHYKTISNKYTLGLISLKDQKRSISVFNTCGLSNVLNIGMNLPKYNLRYNTRDLINSFAVSISDRKEQPLCRIRSAHLRMRFKS